MTEALRAATSLAREGIAVDVINARFAAPVDEKIVSILAEGKDVVVVEDHRVACGFGSAVLEMAASAIGDNVRQMARGEKLGAIRLLGAPRRFIKQDSRAMQLMQAGVSADKIVQAAKELVSLRE
ncbi:MAG: transketolase C-terminal domain-containing protein [Planctomycetota bacterium]